MKKIALMVAMLACFAAGCNEQASVQSVEKESLVPQQQREVGPEVEQNPVLRTAPSTTPAPKKSESNGNCNPNYSGCVPVVSDVDCGGGSGDGPAYFYGIANVIGTDVYGLDRDKDGTACE